MPWGEAHRPKPPTIEGAGTTAKIAEAHRRLDTLGVAPGPLADRIVGFAEKIDRIVDALAEERVDWEDFWPPDPTPRMGILSEVEAHLLHGTTLPPVVLGPGDTFRHTQTFEVT